MSMKKRQPFINYLSSLLLYIRDALLLNMLLIKPITNNISDSTIYPFDHFPS